MLEVPDFVDASKIAVIGDPVLPWSHVRRAIAACVQAAAPNARVHDVWKLGFNLTKNVALLKGVEGVDLAKVHAWIVGIAASDFEKGANGQPTLIGRNGFKWEITFAVWGFIGYQLAGSTDVIELEARKVSATVFTTRGLALKQPGVQALHQVRPLEYASIDVHPFDEGYDVHVAQGRMSVIIDENL